MEHTAHHTTNGAGHEQSEVSVRLIVVSLAFLAVATLVTLVLVVGIFRYFYDANGTAEATRLAQPVIPPEPRIEVAPYEQLQQLRVKEDHVLSTYAYVDKSSGTVRVPIDKAIDLLAASHLPARQTEQPQTAAAGVSLPTASGLGAKMQQSGGPLAGQIPEGLVTAAPAPTVEAPKGKTR